MSIATASEQSREISIGRARLPYPAMVYKAFGIDQGSWKALVEAVFPNATTSESVVLALSYCRARKLDPFKRNVHIVPIWNKDLGRMVDTIWPGIGELRTTAFRTGEYAGRGQTEFGPDLSQKVGNVEMTFPEWAQVTVFRMVRGQRVEFFGPRVYWLETYATYKRGDDSPNEMWKDRPRGQIDKCAEAAALRAAFPEEIGGDCIPEEVQRGNAGRTIDSTATNSLEQLSRRLTGTADEQPAEENHTEDDGSVIAQDGEVVIEGEVDQTTPEPVELHPDVIEAFAGCTTLKQVLDVQETANGRHGKTDEARQAINEAAEAAKERIRAARK